MQAKIFVLTALALCGPISAHAFCYDQDYAQYDSHSCQDARTKANAVAAVEFAKLQQEYPDHRCRQEYLGPLTCQKVNKTFLSGVSYNICCVR